jgi:hypothetical protein
LRVGLLNLRSQAKIPCALKSDTPKQNRMTGLEPALDERFLVLPSRLPSRLVLAALILTAGVVLSRRFLSPPAPRPQAGCGLKPLAIPLHQIDTAALAATPEGDAPDSVAGPADLVRTYVFATLTEPEALAL